MVGVLYDFYIRFGQEKIAGKNTGMKKNDEVKSKLVPGSSTWVDTRQIRYVSNVWWKQLLPIMGSFRHSEVAATFTDCLSYITQSDSFYSLTFFWMVISRIFTKILFKASSKHCQTSLPCLVWDHLAMDDEGGSGTVEDCDSACRLIKVLATRCCMGWSCGSECLIGSWWMRET